MIRYIDSKKMGRGRHNWLDSHFHFSFAEYQNPDNIHFGQLRVINDDIIQPHTGFDPHPHSNMEIISYTVQGQLTHGDSMGNNRTLTRGQVQYMSAGTGVVHSEYNNEDKPLRLLQIWIFPDKHGYEPNYGDYQFAIEDRIDKWLPMVTSYDNSSSFAPIKIHQDMNIFSTIVSAGKQLEFEVATGRQAYLVLIEGSMEINGQQFNMRDGAEIVEEKFVVNATTDSHILLLEMEKLA
ncbi:MAG: pirin family protein [Ignavibacteria bacterium]|jgi:redox-sensitive bicupin YhaK (pirin superfamily)|nr:pirin family protein [Ignavibacteria bacterium]